MYCVQEEVVFCGEFRGDWKAELCWEPLDPSFSLVLLVCQCRSIHNECLYFYVGQLCCGVIFSYTVEKCLCPGTFLFI